MKTPLKQYGLFLVRYLRPLRGRALLLVLLIFMHHWAGTG